jgi:hypothetical protein
MTVSDPGAFDRPPVRRRPIDGSESAPPTASPDRATAEPNRKTALPADLPERSTTRKETRSTA